MLEKPRPEKFPPRTNDAKPIARLAEKRPPPPEDLVEALQDRVHPASGVAIDGRPLIADEDKGKGWVGPHHGIDGPTGVRELMAKGAEDAATYAAEVSGNRAIGNLIVANLVGESPPVTEAEKWWLTCLCVADKAGIDGVGHWARHSGRTALRNARAAGGG
jgi:hypothetical protein